MAVRDDIAVLRCEDTGAGADAVLRGCDDEHRGGQHLVVDLGRRHRRAGGRAVQRDALGVRHDLDIRQCGRADLGLGVFLTGVGGRRLAEVGKGGGLGRGERRINAEGGEADDGAGEQDGHHDEQHPQPGRHPALLRLRRVGGRHGVGIRHRDTVGVRLKRRRAACGDSAGDGRAAFRVKNGGRSARRLRACAEIRRVSGAFRVVDGLRRIRVGHPDCRRGLRAGVRVRDRRGLCTGVRVRDRRRLCCIRGRSRRLRCFAAVFFFLIEFTHGSDRPYG